MIGQIVEVVESDRHLSLDYGSMVVSSRGTTIGRVALDDILAVIVNPHGATMSAGILAALAERNIPFVVAGPHFKPVAVLTPLIGHHEVSARIQSQVRASVPAQKQAWKQVVRSKLTMQATALECSGASGESVRALIGTVRSGDPENVEAQAARRYWPLLFGKEFRRDREQHGINALLNYGYAIIRAGVARAIAATGLHPSIGIHHMGAMDTLRLADDLMEPYRTLVDVRVHGMAHAGILEVDPVAKRMLVAILSTDVPTEAGISPVSVAMYRTARSLAAYFQGERERLELPTASYAEAMRELADVAP